MSDDDEPGMRFIEDDGEHDGEHYSAVVPALVPDERSDDAICNACLRDVHPRRVQRVGGSTLCAHCLSAVRRMQPDDRMLRWFVSLPREERRAKIMLAHKLDPVTGAYVGHLARAERVSLISDVDGIPAGVEVRTGNHGFGGGVHVLPIPTYWDRYARDAIGAWRAAHPDVP